MDKILDDGHGLFDGLSFLETATMELKELLAPDGIIVMVIGDVARSKSSVISPARELIRRLHQQNSFRFIGCLSDYISAEGKTTRIWKETKGKATVVDRIVVLSQGDPYVDREQQIYSDNFDPDYMRLAAKHFAGI